MAVLMPGDTGTWPGATNLGDGVSNGSTHAIPQVGPDLVLPLDPPVWAGFVDIIFPEA